MTVLEAPWAAERPATPETVLVTGGTGFIGRRLLVLLLECGSRVRVLTRNTQPSTESDDVHYVKGDLAEPRSLAAALDGCTAVVHLAGTIREASQFWPVNATGTRNLLDAAGRARIAHLVHMSSVGVMGARRPGLVTESEPCEPTDDYERSKLEGERIALRWSDDTGIPVTILRPTIVFGARPRGAGDSLVGLLRAIQAGRFVYFDNQAVANYVYVDDVADACVRALGVRTAGVFIVADPCLLREFVTTAADALQVARPHRRLPLLVAFGAAAALQGSGRLLGRASPLTIARVRALSNRTRFASAEISRALEWTPPVGWAEGLRRTIATYRAAGAL